MLALSMVVITALIGAPGLGRNLHQALSKVDVGAAFDAGIAIVILAIILDRLTYAAGERLDPRERSARPRRAGHGRDRRRGRARSASSPPPPAIDATEFPDRRSVLVQRPGQHRRRLGHGTCRAITIGFKDLITTVFLNPLETILTEAPVPLVIGSRSSRLGLSGVRAAVVAAASLALIVALGLWAHAMATLANVLVGTVLTLAIGLGPRHPRRPAMTGSGPRSGRSSTWPRPCPRSST